MKPLDFVKTPKGAVAIIRETNGNGGQASIDFLGGGNPTGEKNAWWGENDGLKVIDNLPHLLAKMSCHPFGAGREDVENTYPITEREGSQ